MKSFILTTLLLAIYAQFEPITPSFLISCGFWGCVILCVDSYNKDKRVKSTPEMVRQEAQELIDNYLNSVNAKRKLLYLEVPFEIYKAYSWTPNSKYRHVDLILDSEYMGIKLIGGSEFKAVFKSNIFKSNKSYDYC